MENVSMEKVIAGNMTRECDHKVGDHGEGNHKDCGYSKDDYSALNDYL